MIDKDQLEKWYELFSPSAYEDASSLNIVVVLINEIKRLQKILEGFGISLDGEEEAAMCRAYRMAKELLNTTPDKAFKMLKNGELPEGSIAESEFSSLEWLMKNE